MQTTRNQLDPVNVAKLAANCPDEQAGTRKLCGPWQREVTADPSFQNTLDGQQTPPP